MQRSTSAMRSITRALVSRPHTVYSLSSASAQSTSLLVASSRPLLRTATASYHERVIDHYENPRNVGSMDKSDPDVGTGLVGAPACGDVMKLQLRIQPDGRITEARFKTFGCGSAIASSSLATTMAEGKTVDEVMKIRNSDIAKHLSLPPVKLHCSMLAEDAIKAAVKDWQNKRKAANAQHEQTQQPTQQTQQAAKQATAQA